MDAATGGMLSWAYTSGRSLLKTKNHTLYPTLSTITPDLRPY